MGGRPESKKHYLSGTSVAARVKLYEMSNVAQSNGKEAINLGLGINSGIRRFKEKWGGVPFLPCETAVVHLDRGTPGIERLAQKL